MKQKKLILFGFLITLAIICYSQTKEPKTITVKIPQIKIAPSLCLGYVSPVMNLGGNTGWGLNSQVNFPVGKYFYCGLNYAFQITGRSDNFEKGFNSKLYQFGGAAGVKFQVKRDLAFSLGAIINKGFFIPPGELKTWNNVYMMEMALKYKLNNRFNFINKIQFGGGNDMVYNYSYYPVNYFVNYRTVNFMFGVEFN
ncbi:MAG: hypothetical protein K9H61_09635 [Bacteroidia bacterium]|nr:hypothetical protein [Bacteroidia bacterium]MCF8425138.1 hypothetical protein [Bacteroidia bacterium]MCF8447242.1 hypothetical protein [Bacteroidia bacterium]